MKQKIILSILGLIPIALSIGGIAFIVSLLLTMNGGVMDVNPSLKAMTYIAIMFVALIVCAFLWAAYKIFSYMRNN